MKKFLLTALALSLGFSVAAQELRTLDLVDPDDSTRTGSTGQLAGEMRH
ncbi:hypothetical protein [Necropsobacter massiliensis]|nr:hypothetical protein [Necropsobacter massiliensis]